MGWRTGLQTYGAQYISSVAKTADDVERIVPGYNPTELVMRNANEWLVDHAGPAHDAASALKTIRTKAAGRRPHEISVHLSLGQTCEERLWFETRGRLDEKMLMHALAHSGPDHHWVTAPPLIFNSWNMTPPEWTAATRRRLGVDVFPAETQCPFCHWGRSDARGNHASMCEGGASRILRHNEVRAVLGKALTDLGYTIGFEHGGGLLDGRKPGDIIAYNWTEGKHMLVDVAVTNPLALSNHPHLLAGGPGRTAKYRESRKRAKYWDLDLTKYHFVPFVIETTGAFGPSASRLCAQMRQIKEMKCCKGADSPNSQPKDTDRTTHDPLRTAISVTVQQHNARMILERQPATTCLIDPAIERCHKDAASVKRWALKQLTKAPAGPYLY